MSPLSNELQRSLFAERLRKSSILTAVPLPTPFVLSPGSTTPPWIDAGRTRPRYFDGKFLAARDLERDQAYVAARQAEYLRAAGAGVLHGLEAIQLDPTTVRVAAGTALTAGGGLVVLREQADLAFGDGLTTQRLDHQLGLTRTPNGPGRRGTGVYALLARPVEFTANPIGFYPASIRERRTPEDGETVEAVAFTLVPFRDPAADVEPSRQRAGLARRLFLERADPGVPIEAVPLALVKLERGFVRWVDPWLVRREIGAAHAGMGRQRRVPLAVAEAHVQQYREQLAEVLSRRAEPFAATEEFAALPPVGPYPLGALDLAARTDRFFPAATQLTLHVTPADELTAIVEEALTLPPLDLASDPVSLGATPTAVVLGLPRRDVEALPPRLRRFTLRSAASGSAPLDTTGSTARLVDLVAATTPVALFARLRRALGDTEEGVLRVERQVVG